MEDGDDLVNCCGCHSKVTEPDGSEYFVPKQFKYLNKKLTKAKKQNKSDEVSMD
jgi:hypothetical protein